MDKVAKLLKVFQAVAKENGHRLGVAQQPYCGGI
jgi:hypothetical protein